MKVVFLDIDEVLVNPKEWFVFGNVWAKALMASRKIDQTGKYFFRLLHAAGVKIVLCSTWRLGLTPKKASKVLDIPIYDCTGTESWRTEKEEDKIRGTEIAAWLSRNPGVENYVIVEDGLDFTKEQLENHHVHIKGHITHLDMEKICTILGFDEPWKLRYQYDPFTLKKKNRAQRRTE